MREVKDEAAVAKVFPSQVEDEALYDIEFVCHFFGGNKPLHPATIYRGIRAGRLPAPVCPSPNVRRWLGKDLTRAKQAIIGLRAA